MKDVRNPTPEDYEEKALSIGFGQIRVRIDRAPYQIPYVWTSKELELRPDQPGPFEQGRHVALRTDHPSLGHSVETWGLALQPDLIRVTCRRRRGTGL